MPVKSPSHHLNTSQLKSRTILENIVQVFVSTKLPGIDLT